MERSDTGGCTPLDRRQVEPLERLFTASISSLRRWEEDFPGCLFCRPTVDPADRVATRSASTTDVATTATGGEEAGGGDGAAAGGAVLLAGGGGDAAAA